MKLLAVATLFLAAAIAFPVAAQTTTPAAQTDVKILMEKLKADKKQVVSSNLTMSETEAKGFWPVYDAYQKDLDALNRRIAAAVLEFADAYRKGPVPDSIATKVLAESMAIEEDEIKAKRAMVDKLNAVVAGTVAARYVQIENKIRTMIRMELAAGIPLAY